MRILGILDNRFYLSGVNAYWSSMAKALGALGHQVHTLAIDDGTCPWNRRFFEALNGRAHRLQINSSSPPQRTVNLFLDVHPDLVVHHYSDFGLDMSLYARSNIRGFSWKDVYLCHSDDPDHYNRIEKRKATLAHVICVSETCRNHLIHQLGFSPEETSLGHYFFAPPSGAADAVARKSSISSASGPMGMLYAGRLETYQKRAGDLVPFAELLRKRRVPFRLQIAGSGSLESKLRGRLAPLVSAGAVVFHGYVDEDHLFDLMEEARIYVSFSEFEGLSTSLIQAMHFGLIPLITSTKSGTDFLEHRKEALFFDVGDIETAVGLVQRLFEDPHLQGKMVRHAAEKLAQQFCQAKSSRQFSSLFQK